MSLLTRLFLIAAIVCTLYVAASAILPMVAVYVMFIFPIFYLLNAALFPSVMLFLLSYGVDLIRKNRSFSAGAIPIGIAVIIIVVALIPTLIARHRIEAYISASMATPKLHADTTLDTPLIVAVNNNGGTCEEDCRNALYAGLVGKWVVPFEQGTYKQYALSTGSSCENQPWGNAQQQMNLYQLLGRCIAETVLNSAPDGIWVEHDSKPDNLPPYKYRGSTITVSERKGGPILSLLARNETGSFRYPGFPPAIVTYLNSAEASLPTVRVNSKRLFGNQKDWMTLVAETTNFALPKREPDKSGVFSVRSTLITNVPISIDQVALLEKVQNYSLISKGRSIEERAAFFSSLGRYLWDHPELFDKVLPTIMEGIKEESAVKSAALGILASDKTPNRQQFIPIFLEMAADKEQFDKAIVYLLRSNPKLDEETLLKIVRGMPKRQETRPDTPHRPDSDLVRFLERQGPAALPALSLLMESRNSDTVKDAQRAIAKIKLISSFPQ